MPPPNDATVFSTGIYICASEDGQLSLSSELSRLFVQAREQYAWPQAITPQESQRRIIDLETQAQTWIKNLNCENGWLLMQNVVEWGGNNKLAISAIRVISQQQKRESAQLLSKLLDPTCVQSALQRLTDLAGIDLVMASKIFRFCAPKTGAAIDRHCSYFFNSLRDLRADEPRACTQFRREWSNGKHKATRLATYYNAARIRNLEEDFSSYLPLLAAIADSLNRSGGGFLCAVSNKRTPWRPTDVEMAAYQWWSRNGPS